MDKKTGQTPESGCFTEEGERESWEIDWWVGGEGSVSGG